MLNCSFETKEEKAEIRITIDYLDFFTDRRKIEELIWSFTCLILEFLHT